MPRGNAAACEATHLFCPPRHPLCDGEAAAPHSGGCPRRFAILKRPHVAWPREGNEETDMSTCALLRKSVMLLALATAGTVPLGCSSGGPGAQVGSEVGRVAGKEATNDSPVGEAAGQVVGETAGDQADKAAD